MLIIKLRPEENGAHGSQLCNFALPEIPEGWAVVPPELEQQAMELLPWVTLEIADGKIIGVADNAEARAAAAAQLPAENCPTPSQLDRVEAQSTYTALITDTLLPEV